MKLLTTTADIQAAIKSITSRGKKLDNDIWVAAVSVMAHHEKHGDVTLINELVAGMPKGSRVNALREFIMKHGKVTFDEENQIFLHDKEGNFDLDGAQEKSWTEFKPDPKYVPVDALALITALAKKIKAERKEGDKVSPAQHTAIMAFAAEMGVEVK